MSVTVKTEKGKTSGSVEYYAEADPAIGAIYQRFKDGRVDSKQVFSAVSKIAGMRRLEKDWKDEAKAGEGWIAAVDKFEAWLAQKPQSYSRIYGSPEVIAKIIIAQAGMPELNKESE